MLAEHTASLVAALVSAGMGLAFYLADRSSPTSRALSLALAATGLSIVLDVLLVKPLGAAAPWWSGLTAIAEVVAFCAVFEWILRVRRTLPAAGLRTRFGDRALRFAQGLAVFYGLMSIFFPQQRAGQFLGGFYGTGEAPGVVFYLFAAPLELAMLLAVGSALLVLNRRPDRAEAIRLIALCIAIPFTASGLILPTPLAALSTVFGLLILLIGAVQYHVLQGQRGLFLSRFLSPQVARLVHTRGLRSVMHDKNIELSIVCCDLRGFTAFAEATSSQSVIAVLRTYYDVVGRIATDAGGTIKDYAGDGILILVGAPLAVPNHARSAIAMARQIRLQASTIPMPDGGEHLGIGIGVASGPVTVGIVGGAGRMEYAAVGPAVNLASRLCDLAGAGEILVDARTPRLLGQQPGEPASFEPRAPVSLKGVGCAVENYLLVGT